MSSNNILGVAAGTIIGFGTAASPIGDLPFLFLLSNSGVSNPSACLDWMKGQTTFFLAHPCSPITNPSSLELMSNVLVFIAIGFLVWKGIEILVKQ